MSLILAWVLFPVVLVAVGAGWGGIVERLAGTRVTGALVVPLGLATALVVASLLTSWAATAPASVPVVGVGAAVGLVLARSRMRIQLWPLLAAVGVLLAYGAPVLLSGTATFLGYIRLDDTATWLGIIDRVMTHGRDVSGLAPSTYALELHSILATNYPLGSFMLPGIGHGLTGIDAAWIFQPYLACCGAAVALCVYALTEPFVASPRRRMLVALIGGQPALLYGYSLWGGIKELTAAFLLVLGAAVAAPLIARRPGRPRELLPLAIAAGALMVTLGAGSVAWILPALAVLAVAWLRPWRGVSDWRAVATSVGALTGLTAVAALPLWVVLGSFLGNDSSLFSAGESTHAMFGNLFRPLRAFQVAGIWPVGDFRLPAPTLASALLIGVALIAAVAALWVSVRRGVLGLALYVWVALAGCGVVYLAGGTPWVVGKALAISSPALLAAGLAGGALLSARRRLFGALVMAVLCGGVLWSNALAYHDVLLAPRPRLAELQRIGDLVAGKGPTFLNEYDVYADRHFLRAGDPVEPAEYRTALLPLLTGESLTASAWADLDSFPMSTLLPYRSIVVRRTPVESRPPSLYQLRWQGRYYELWQRPAQPAVRIVEHVPLGDSNKLPFCGQASGEAASRPLCSIQPVAIPPCAQIRQLAQVALRNQGRLVAYVRSSPITARGDDTIWPGPWTHDPAGHNLIPTTPGTAVMHIAVASGQTYEVWLGGSFARGFSIRIDGHDVGRVKDELTPIGGYVHVTDIALAPGVHTFAFAYPHPDLTPGSGDNGFTVLTAVALEPTARANQIVTVDAQHATRLCGQALDWLEVVAPLASTQPVPQRFLTNIAQIERAIAATVLQKERRTGTARCPSHVPAVTGGTFTCVVAIGHAKPEVFTVTQQNSLGTVTYARTA